MHNGHDIALARKALYHLAPGCMRRHFVKLREVGQ